MEELWRTAFVQQMEEFFRQIGAFLPYLLAMLAIIGIGFVVAWVVKAVIARLLKVTRLDQFSNRLGFSQALSKGGVREAPSSLIGRIIYWVIFLSFLMMGLKVLNLRPVNLFVIQVFAYVPHLLVALVILSVGILLANFFARAALIAAVNAQVTQARFLARAVHLAIILFALAMAFEQLGIAKTIIVAAFSISFGGVVMALAIAFGLGAKDAVKDFIDKQVKKEEEPKEEDLSHI
jgi:hypothetical protein